MKKGNAFRKGDIIIVSFPFSDFPGEKRRPALVIGCSKEHVIVAFVTSKKTDAHWLVPIPASNKTGLLVPSYVRCDKLLAIDIAITEGGIGTVRETILRAVDAKLRRLLSL